jgi:tRNA pseudouridine55 synthase
MAVLEGVLPVDKPEGPTSHDVVSAARRALAERRIGHTGTLDPFASGLMLLCVGPATRLSEFLTGMDKTYDATLHLGVTTDSGDRDGEVLERADGWRDVTAAQVEAALGPLRGTVLQVPPALSAKKVGGVAAHRRVRRGEDVTLDAVEVTVYEATVLALRPPEVRLRVRCSSGTYIRALARDLGHALGVGAHLTALRRTSVHGFTVDDAIALTDLVDADRVSGAMLTPLQALAHLPRLEVDADGAAALGHGRRIDAGGAADAPTVVAAGGGRVLAVGAVAEGSFRPRKVFVGA